MMPLEVRQQFPHSSRSEQNEKPPRHLTRMRLEIEIPNFNGYKKRILGGGGGEEFYDMLVLH